MFQTQHECSKNRPNLVNVKSGRADLSPDTTCCFGTLPDAYVTDLPIAMQIT
jgi:hypothetical protein